MVAHNKKGSSSTAAQTIVLQPRVDIASVSFLRDEWLLLVGSSKKNIVKDVIIDGSQVESFSTAAAQLVLSFANMLRVSGGSLKMVNLSSVLLAVFSSLGLDCVLGLEDVSGLKEDMSAKK